MPLMFSVKIYIQYVCFPIMHRLLDFLIVKFYLVDQLLKLTFYFHTYLCMYTIKGAVCLCIYVIIVLITYHVYCTYTVLIRTLSI